MDKPIPDLRLVSQIPHIVGDIKLDCLYRDLQTTVKKADKVNKRVGKLLNSSREK